MRLADKVAVVTGAGQGIGRAYADALASEGARVVIADVRIEGATAAAESIRAAGGDAMAVAVDVADEDSVQNMVTETVEKYGTVDVLVNNAAIFSTLKMRPFTEIPVQEWNQVLAVNATGTFFACRAVAPIMKKNRYGRIINIASSAVATGKAEYAHYVASKGAVWALTHALATELGEFEITVNAISPHGIETEVPRETLSEEQWTQSLRVQALKRRGRVDDLVGALIFLASDESQYMTGQTLSLDAGLRYT